MPLRYDEYGECWLRPFPGEMAILDWSTPVTTDHIGDPYPAIESSSSALADALRVSLAVPHVNLDHGVALVGCGWVANEHLRSYAAAGVRVVGLFDRGRDKAVALRDAYYPDARVYNSLEELLEDTRVEIVDVATHVDSRAAIITHAIRAGKHILSQKPFVEDLRVGAELARLAKEAGVVLAVNQNGRWAPHFGALLGCVASGVIGQVASADFFVAWEHDTDVASRPAAALFSSMQDLILFDFGAHWFDLVGVLAPDEPLEVRATTAMRAGQVIAAPTQAEATISSPSFFATLNFRSAERFAETGWYRVSGTEGVVTFTGRSLGGEKVTVTTSEGEATIHVSDDWFGHGMVGTLRELIRAIDSKDEPSNSAESALRGLSLCFAATVSAQNGDVVSAGAQHRRNAEAVA